MNPPGTAPAWLAGIRCVALDYGGTIDRPGLPLIEGSRPVDPAAVPVLRALAGRGLTLILSSNTKPGEHRMAALAAAGVDRLFRLVLQSACLCVAKPDPDFYALVKAGAHCWPREILHVGNKMRTDVIGPASAGMHTALIRPPGGITDLERQVMPPGSIVISGLAELARLLGCQHAPGPDSTGSRRES